MNNGVVPAGDALEIHVDPAAAAMKGVTAGRGQGPGRLIISMARSSRAIWARSRTSGSALARPASATRSIGTTLGKLPIRSPMGTSSRCRASAQIDFRRRPARAHPRQSARRSSPVTAVIGGGHDLGSTIAGGENGSGRAGRHSRRTSTTSIGGAYEQQQLAINGMIIVAAAAVVAEVVLLLFLYRELRDPGHHHRQLR